MKHFYKFIAITNDEYDGNVELSEYKYDDYRVWGLYSKSDDEMIFFNDNIHCGSIEDEIQAFLGGLDYAHMAYLFETGVVITTESSYYPDLEKVKRLLREDKMIKTEL